MQPVQVSEKAFDTARTRYAALPHESNRDLVAARGCRQKRVLFVAGDAPFFVTHFFDLANALRDEGINVHLAAPVDAASGRDDLEAVGKIEAAGMILHRISLKRSSVNPFADLILLKELNDLIADTHPSVIHCLGIKPILYAGSLARLKCLPAVHSVIGLGLPYEKRFCCWIEPFIDFAGVSICIRQSALQHHC